MRLATNFKRSNALQSNVALDNDQLRAVAPSIFAHAPHDSRSNRYTYIPTVNILDGLQENGFEPFFVCQATSRVEGKGNFTKHMLRLRHASQSAGQEANEIILVNSHDGTSSYQMVGGVFRFVCRNGLVVGNAYGEVRVPHKGNIEGQVIEGAYEILGAFDRINAQTEDMKAITLRPAEQEAFATSALLLKYESEEAAPITPAAALEARRYDDWEKKDLWTTFNNVQENLVRGGLPGRTANNRRTRTREVRGIDQTVKLNRALWTLAESMAKLKAA